MRDVGARLWWDTKRPRLLVRARAQPDVPPVQITSSRAVARAHCSVSVRNGHDIDSYALLDLRSRSTAARSLAARVPSPFAYVITRRGTGRIATPALVYIFMYLFLVQRATCQPALVPFRAAFTLRDPRAIYRVGTCQLPDPINSILRLCIVIEGSRNRNGRNVSRRV